MWTRTLVATCLLAVTVSAQVAQPTPPRLGAGAAPALPALAVGGGQVLIEVSISATGQVTGLGTLRTTPPFTDAVNDAVRRWRFTPATAPAPGENGLPGAPKPVASRALVAGQFRAPTLMGPSGGEPPKDAGAPSAEVPFPVSTAEPGYPPQALSSGVVLIEALVDHTGSVTEVRAIRSAPPFDAPAIEAARHWRFRPARVGGGTMPAYVYLIFGFPQPVTGPRAGS